MKSSNKFLLRSQHILRNFTHDLYQDNESILTKEETKEIKKNVKSGFVDSKDIDWEHIENLDFK